MTRYETSYQVRHRNVFRCCARPVSFFTFCYFLIFLSWYLLKNKLAEIVTSSKSMKKLSKVEKIKKEFCWCHWWLFLDTNNASTPATWLWMTPWPLTVVGVQAFKLQRLFFFSETNVPSHPRPMPISGFESTNRTSKFQAMSGPGPMPSHCRSHY